MQTPSTAGKKHPRQLANLLKAWLLASSVSTHLSDVPHLILKVTDRPLPGHHLLLSFRARPLAGHFGPMVLQRCIWDPIGHVSVGLREATFHRSGQVSPDSLADSCLYCISVFLHFCAHTSWMRPPAYLHLVRYFQLRCR